MKEKIHLESKEVKVTCTTCNKKHKILSTTDNIKVDICSGCHPFYTGKQTSGAKKGRIDKFNQRLNKQNK